MIYIGRHTDATRSRAAGICVIAAAESMVIVAVITIVCGCGRKVHRTSLLHGRTMLWTWFKALTTEVGAEVGSGLGVTCSELCRNAWTVSPRDVSFG